jgi:hypothetical protein
MAPHPPYRRESGGVGDAYPLENVKQLLKNFYAGQQIPSPNGGYLLLLGIRPEDGGGSLAFFECSSSSLRYQMEIPKATRAERKKVKDVIDAGQDPDCPRHGSGYRLVRAGKDVVCNLCGVAFAKA